MNIKLQTHDNKRYLEFRDIVYAKPSYECILIINSNGFAAERRFWFGESYLGDFVKNIKYMDSSFEGEAVLREEFEDDFIKISCDKKGHIYVSGLIVEHSEVSQQLEFAFIADQTCLKPLILDIEKLKER